jgi:hypothetical protein
MGRVSNSVLCTVACFDGTGVTFYYHTTSSTANTNYTWIGIKTVLIANSENPFTSLFILHLTFKNRASYIKDGRTATIQMLHFVYIYFFNNYKY